MGRLLTFAGIVVLFVIVLFIVSVIAANQYKVTPDAPPPSLSSTTGLPR